MLTSDINSAIETCLDVEAMRAHLQVALAPQGVIEAVRISKTRRSASQQRHPNPLSLCYQVDLRNTNDQATRTLHLYGKVFRAGASGDAVHGTPALRIAKLDLLLWPWPADPGLPQLAQLLEPRAAQPFWGAAANEVRVLRYEPEHRATLRYTHADGPVIYAKTYCDTRSLAVYRRFAWAWERSQQDTDAPLVARPLQCSVDGRTQWQHAAQGTPLLQLIGAGQHVDWVLPLAHAIAAIHNAPVELAGATPRHTDHWLTEVRRRRSKISRVLPEFAEHAEATASAIERAAAHLRAPVPALIHGDFHPDQVWFDGRRIVLFDFDEFALGDPMEDLAEFIVKLPGDSASAQLTALWLGAYAQVAPQHFCGQRLRWHMAVQQLLYASRAFVFQVADWQSEVRRRLERAQRLAMQIDQEMLA